MTVVLVGSLCGDVNLPLVVIPFHISKQCAHASLLECESVDLQFCCSCGFAKEGRGVCLARCLASEFYGMEVYEVQYICHVHLVEVNEERVGMSVCSPAVYADVLVGVSYREVVYGKLLVAICDGCLANVPCSVGKVYFRWQYVYYCQCLPRSGCCKPCVCIEQSF